jgi:hypothetical protein
MLSARTQLLPRVQFSHIGNSLAVYLDQWVLECCSGSLITRITETPRLVVLLLLVELT